MKNIGDLLGTCNLVRRYMLTSNRYFSELSVLCGLLFTAKSLPLALLLFLENDSKSKVITSILPPNKTVTWLMFIYH